MNENLKKWKKIWHIRNDHEIFGYWGRNQGLAHTNEYDQFKSRIFIQMDWSIKEVKPNLREREDPDCNYVTALFVNYHFLFMFSLCVCEQAWVNRVTNKQVSRQIKQHDYYFQCAGAGRWGRHSGGSRLGRKLNSLSTFLCVRCRAHARYMVSSALGLPIIRGLHPITRKSGEHQWPEAMMLLIFSCFCVILRIRISSMCL